MLLSLEAKATRNPGEIRVSYFSTLIADFTVLITGGSGRGTYYAQLELRGAIDDRSRGFSLTTGSTVSVNWPHGIDVGSLSGRAFESPSFFCSESNPLCQVEFEYGVEQKIHFEAHAVVWIEFDVAYLDKPEDKVETIEASMSFEGIGLVRQSDAKPEIKIELLNVATSGEVESRAALAAG